MNYLHCSNINNTTFVLTISLWFRYFVYIDFNKINILYLYVGQWVTQIVLLQYSNAINGMNFSSNLILF